MTWAEELFKPIKKPKKQKFALSLFICLHQEKKVPFIALFKALSMPFIFLPQICLGYACLELTA